ncbi:hypothetical protein B0H19DRAFT_1055497 [Mycena capillaripes]|nr:hypothetical protein B0H19DRAFT_1055497 [Mycena capillaripes]
MTAKRSDWRRVERDLNTKDILAQFLTTVTIICLGLRWRVVSEFRRLELKPAEGSMDSEEADHTGLVKTWRWALGFPAFGDAAASLITSDGPKALKIDPQNF